MSTADLIKAYDNPDASVLAAKNALNLANIKAKYEFGVDAAKNVAGKFGNVSQLALGARIAGQARKNSLTNKIIDKEVQILTAIDKKVTDYKNRLPQREDEQQKPARGYDEFLQGIDKNVKDAESQKDAWSSGKAFA